MIRVRSPETFHGFVEQNSRLDDFDMTVAKGNALRSSMTALGPLGRKWLGRSRTPCSLMTSIRPISGGFTFTWVQYTVTVGSYTNFIILGGIPPAGGYIVSWGLSPGAGDTFAVGPNSATLQNFTAPLPSQAGPFTAPATVRTTALSMELWLRKTS